MLKIRISVNIPWATVGIQKWFSWLKGEFSSCDTSTISFYSSGRQCCLLSLLLFIVLLNSWVSKTVFKYPKGPPKHPEFNRIKEDWQDLERSNGNSWRQKEMEKPWLKLIRSSQLICLILFKSPSLLLSIYYRLGKLSIY